MTRPYVSIDIETTGSDWNICQVIEIGAVIDDFETPIEKLPTFRCYIDHGIFKGESDALSMHAEIFRAIATGETDIRVLNPDGVAYAFRDWLEQNGLKPRLNKIIVAGKNFAAFDRNFLDLLPRWKERVRMKHRFIDPGNMYYRSGIDDAPPNMEECLARAGYDPNVSHKALDDALDVVRLIRWKRDNG